ncbi:MAG: redox-regulated ATPase YchF [Actinobacteria bacterium]|nr:redox-regulated ATPase YchF [Actinomycetota bacterium]
MGLSIGIAGLPNVGKSTLFNALLKKQIADASNYPFCTISPNKGIVAVPDERLEVLAKISASEKIVPAVVEFVDIAGLVEGASKGEGLGNQFLANIREVNAICHVVRFFEDDSIAHINPEIKPVSDVELINTELILADLQTLEKKSVPKGKPLKEDLILWEAVQILKKELYKGKLAINVVLSEEQRKAAGELCLLTMKPIIYVANISEQQISGIENKLEDFPFNPVVPICAKLEAELAVLDDEEQKEYLKQSGLAEPGLNRLIKLAYKTLGLISFLTTGRKETRAWTITGGVSAREAAAVIHTDFSRNFIKAATIDYDEFVRLGGWSEAKNTGKIRFEGADYIVKEGDIIEFKIGC